MTQAYKLFVKYDQHAPFVERSWIFCDNPTDSIEHLALYDSGLSNKPPMPEEIVMIDVDIIKSMGDGGISLFGREMRVFNMHGAKRLGNVETQWPFLELWPVAPTIAIVYKAA